MNHLLVATAVAVLLAAGSAGAREREVQRQGADKTTTVTGAQGRSVTRDVDRTGPGDKTVTTTGPNGQSVTREVDRNGADKSTTVTGPDGKTVERDVDRSVGGKTVTTTGPQGTTVEREVDRSERRDRVRDARERRAARQGEGR